ncbi:MAG: hypothetical protein M1835_003622 [Candelina submexicana]|nr:MAG: hypothetical protein M1835_003622 [Candelina submexicana]
MEASEDLINFDIIETQKENIQSLPSGRSAKALASIFSPSPFGKSASSNFSDTRNLNDSIRREYEQELISITESDDPLDIYDRYVKWTLNAYPSAQATTQSQLLPLLERATKAFLSSSHYKNDPRYLKLWLHYIRMFSDSPRETFAFLARHNIGEGLALFYEEFAAWLEGFGRWTQAEEVYKLGIEKEARPAERLLRKFGEFQHRFGQRPHSDAEPSSPALPTVRPALAAKMDPFAASTPRSTDPQAVRPRSDLGVAPAKSGRQKLAIFSDADASASDMKSSTVETAKGWENIGSLEHRRKENVMEAKPWAGETLKAGKKNGAVSKMMIFKDESLPQSCQGDLPLPPPSTMHIKQTVNPKTGKAERVFVDLEAVYPNPSDPTEEMSFEELRAMRRGWLCRDWSESRRPPTRMDKPISETGQAALEPQSDLLIDKVLADDRKHNLGLKEKNTLHDENGNLREGSHEPRSSRVKKLRVKEIRGETQTIKINLASPTGPKLKRKGSAEPTMTFHTKAATDEIYDIFNQPLKHSAAVEEEFTYGSDDDDAYTSAGESTGTGRISGTSEFGDDETEARSIGENETGVKSVTEWSNFTTSKHVPRLDEAEGETDDQKNIDVQDENVAPVEDTQYEGIPDYPEGLVTPVSPTPEDLPLRTRFIPLPPENYEAPTRPFRDASQASLNRLPFMTPIVEKTESSLAPSTVYIEKDYFNSKTPSRAHGDGSSAATHLVDDLWSSPFQEIINEAVITDRKLLQPALSKPSKAKTVPPIGTKATAVVKAVDSQEKVSKGPLITDAQCNPVDDYTRDIIFEKLQPPLSSYEGFFERKGRVNGRSAEIRKYAKAVTKVSKNSSEKTTSNLSMPPLLNFKGADRKYMVKRELGKGAFAPVYLVENVHEDEDQVQDTDEPSVKGKDRFGPSRKNLEAMKMEDPPTAWEFYIMRQAKRRLGVSRAADSIIHAYETHLFADECFLFLEYRDQGTLLDLVNIAKAEASSCSGVMDETLVMFFTIELFRTVESLHSKGILHGDLKADNCLVRFDPVADSEWSSRYRPDGTGGWNAKGIALIDFGRGIDMKTFRHDVQFIADWKTGPQDCAEMREMRPWTYQVDYHGLAGIIHSLLFGKYIDTVAEKGAALGNGATRTHRIREGLKRYWQQEIWGEVFDLLLNPGKGVEAEEGGRLPVLRGMRRVREGMEEWLVGNCERGRGLKGGIRRLEEAIRERRR